MQIIIAWRYIDSRGHWLILVTRDRVPIALIVRKSEEECQQWANKNIRLYQQGLMPQYG